VIVYFDTSALVKRLVVRDALKQPITFACADAKLVAAAKGEGLDVAP
jgi:hypothetical protein